LTAEGELLLDRARRIREEWRETEASVSQGKAVPLGRLRVATPAVGHRLLAPHLAAFAERYPHVMLDLDDRIVDLTMGRIDVAICCSAWGLTLRVASSADVTLMAPLPMTIRCRLIGFQVGPQSTHSNALYRRIIVCPTRVTVGSRLGGKSPADPIPTT
jgi:DNA-binding transcriptional LysR family regulator